MAVPEPNPNGPYGYGPGQRHPNDYNGAVFFGQTIDPNSSVDAQYAAAQRDPRKAARYDEMRENFSYGFDPGASAFGDLAREHAQAYAAPIAAAGNAASAAGAGMYSAGTGYGNVGNNMLGLDSSRNMAASAYGAGMAGSDRMFATGDALNAMATGPTPASVAEAQMAAGTAAANRAATSLAGSGRGFGGGAAAMRNAQRVHAGNLGQLNANLGVVRAQEAAADRAFRADALGAAGGMYGAAGNLGLGAGGYYTGARQGAEDTAFGTALGYGNLGLGYQSGAVDAYGTAATAHNAAAGVGMGGLNLAHQANMGGLQGGMGYEGQMYDYHNTSVGGNAAAAEAAQRKKAALWSGIGTAAGATVGAVAGGPAGAAAGGTIGGAAGNAASGA